MPRPIVLFLFLLLNGLSGYKVFGQDTKKHFEVVKQIVGQATNASMLIQTLDSLYRKGIPSRSDLNLAFSRDIDFNHRHQRIYLDLNFERHQIDLITHKDSIWLSVLTHRDNKRLRNIHYQKNPLTSYLATRNRFYNSTKTIQELAEDISKEVVYAFYCGDGSPKTEEGKRIEQLVKSSNTRKLGQMLTSFNVETQTFGVAGFDMLSNSNRPISLEQKNIIQHIKRRNSEVEVCKGCLSGLVDKAF